MRYVKYLILSILLGTLSTGMLCAQTDPIQAVIKQAREQATSKRYADAIATINRGLENYPQDYDLKLMRARVLAWKGDYTMAADEVNKLKAIYPANLELLELAGDIQYWAGNFHALIDLCNEIIAIQPKHFTALYRKAVAQHELDQNENALQTILQVLAINPANTPALSLERLIREQLLKNEIGISYRYSTFSEIFTDWHNASLHYTRNTGIGPLIFRSSIARQFDINGFQQELDMYPRLGRKSYAYLNLGFSNADIFPRTRFGAELFHALPAGFEASAGIRYMYYNVSDDELWIYTAHLSKYFGNHMLSFRPMFIQLQDEITHTSILSYRNYLSNRDHFLGVTAAYGRAPVEFVSLFEILRLSAARLTLEYNFPLSNNFFGRAMAEFQHEEYLEKVFRQRYSLEIGLSKRF